MEHETVLIRALNIARKSRIMLWIVAAWDDDLPAAGTLTTWRGLHMGELLDGLHRLQALELKLAVFRRAHDAKARQVELNRRRLRQVEEQIAALHKNIRELQIATDQQALEAASREDSISKHRQALTKAKTNKEYAAILTAMNTEKADNMKIENEVLKKMEALQELKEQEKALGEQRDKILEDVKRAEESLKVTEDESHEERSRLEAQRDEEADRIEPTALAAFQRVAQKNDGEAMAVVEKLHPKRDEYLCGGCNMNISLEKVNSLQVRDEIQLCDVCGRILYLSSQSTGMQKARA
jgi:uncharacterized protein